jgi:hypothetical protein
MLNSSGRAEFFPSFNLRSFAQFADETILGGFVDKQVRKKWSGR